MFVLMLALAANAADEGEPAAGTEANAILSAARDATLASHLDELLAAGGDVNAHTPRGETALQVAASAGNSPGVEVLLRHGASIDEPGAHGTTALGWAARNGYEPVARLLLDKGADPDAAGEADKIPFALAIAQQHPAIARLLLDRGSKALTNPTEAAFALHALVDSGALAGTEPPKNAKPAIAAIEQTHRELVALVVPALAGKIASDPDLERAAADAVAAASPRLAAAILDGLRPASQSRSFQTALLFSAVEIGRVAVANLAIARGADIDAVRMPLGTPLAIATSRGDPALITALIAGGANVTGEKIDAARLEELAGAAVADRRQAALAEHDGTVDMRDEQGRTLLFRAAARGDDALVRELLASHADPSAIATAWPGGEGWTPLMVAAAAGHRRTIELLVAAGVDVDQVNASGRTALMFAAFYGRAQAVDALIAGGADPGRTDTLGESALTLGEAFGDPPTLAVLRGHRRATAAFPPVAAGPDKPAAAAPSVESPAKSSDAPSAASSPAAAMPVTPAAMSPGAGAR